MYNKYKMKNISMIDIALKAYNSGNLKQAAILLEEILNKETENIYALKLLGVINYQLGSYDYAIYYMEKLISINPNDIEALYIIGHSYQEKGVFELAIKYYQKILELNPNVSNAYYNLGTIFQDSKNYNDAIICYKNAVRLNQNDVDAIYNLANIFQEEKRFDEAIDLYKKALKINPELADAYNNIGVIFLEKGQFNEALEYFSNALRLNPKLADAYNNIGTIYYEQDQLEDAITYFEKSIELNPEFIDAYKNLADIMIEKHEFIKAKNYLNNALKISPNNAEVHLSLSHLLLLEGNLKIGWEEYEWRWKTKSSIENSVLHKPDDFNVPTWDGTYQKDKSLYIYTEQGLGDVIMFASCLNDVAEKVKTCMVECDKRLSALFKRSFPNVNFIEIGKNNSLELYEADMVIPIGSLPRIFRNEIKEFPKMKNYLIADKEKAEIWKNRLNNLGEGLKIGISWRGGKIPRIRRKRSIELHKLKDILSLRNAHFINLQYGDNSKEITDVEENIGIRIHNFENIDSLKDLENFSSLICALDLVITVDNANAHLAGALGVPVWILLPFACDWRWMLNTNYSPWYQSAYLFRQPIMGDWQSVISNVKRKLYDLI